MKKLLLTIFLLLAFAGQGWAGGPWYACDNSAGIDFLDVSGTTISNVWNDAANCAGNWLDLSAGYASDTFYANALTVDVDATITVGQLNTTAGSGTAGGTFSITTNATPITVTATSATAGSEHAITVAGSAAGANVLTLTIGTLNGSSTTANKYAVSSTHTNGTVIINGNIVGGSSAMGLYHNSTTGLVTINGNCSAGVSTVGCSSGNKPITLVGNIINGTKATGVTGGIIWNPTPPSSGVNGHYIKFDGSGTAVYVGKNTETQSKAMTDFYYFTAASETSTVGTGTSGGGGGAWGF